MKVTIKVDGSIIEQREMSKEEYNKLAFVGNIFASLFDYKMELTPTTKEDIQNWNYKK